MGLAKLGNKLGNMAVSNAKFTKSVADKSGGTTLAVARMAAGSKKRK